VCFSRFLLNEKNKKKIKKPFFLPRHQHSHPSAIANRIGNPTHPQPSYFSSGYPARITWRFFLFFKIQKFLIAKKSINFFFSTPFQISHQKNVQKLIF
jgi:hypothetical protein